MPPPEQWERAYGEIVDHERMLVSERMLIVKFWLHVSDEEQLKRFQEREKDPLKSWKLTDEDFRNREKRPEYQQAIEDMLARTDHGAARWHLVEAESKHYARVKVMETMIGEIERAMRGRGLPGAGLGRAERIAAQRRQGVPANVYTARFVRDPNGTSAPPPRGVSREQRQVRLALAPQHAQIHLYAHDSSRLPRVRPGA